MQLLGTVRIVGRSPANIYRMEHSMEHSVCGAVVARGYIKNLSSGVIFFTQKFL